MEPHSPGDCREMKVRLPARLATALHAHKILTGEMIGNTVEKALREYFALQPESCLHDAPPFLEDERSC